MYLIKNVNSLQYNFTYTSLLHEVLVEILSSKQKKSKVRTKTVTCKKHSAIQLKSEELALKVKLFVQINNQKLIKTVLTDRFINNMID